MTQLYFKNPQSNQISKENFVISVDKNNITPIILNDLLIDNKYKIKQLNNYLLKYNFNHNILLNPKLIDVLSLNNTYIWPILFNKSYDIITSYYLTGFNNTIISNKTGLKDTYIGFYDIESEDENKPYIILDWLQDIKTNNIVGIAIISNNNTINNFFDNNIYSDNIKVFDLFQLLNYKHFGAAATYHIHQGDSIGIIPQSKGGLQNETNNKIVKLETFYGPLVYYNNDTLDKLNLNTNGVYYSNGEYDNHIHVGMPDWKHGAIPYKTNQEQLEHVYRTIPLNSTIRIPKWVGAGMLSANGQTFHTIIPIDYIIPEGTTKIKVAGNYIIRQHGGYLFTSGNNYINGWAEPYADKPTSNPNYQKINQAESYSATGCWVDWDTNYNRECMQLRFRRNGESQTVSYTYKASATSATTTFSATGWLSGAIEFENLELTFTNK